MIKKLKLTELARVTAEVYRKQTKLPVRLALDNVRSALNVGSCFRTSDGFGIAGLDLCGITATPPHKAIQKTALGASEVVHWTAFDSMLDCIHQRKSEGYSIVAVEQTNQSIALQDWLPVTYQKTEKILLIFGNEVTGVSQPAIELVDYALEIPQFGTKHSFNVAVSVGIVLWHYQCLYLKYDQEKTNNR